MQFFSKKVLFLGKNKGHGLHFATVASGELVKHSADQGGVRRYNSVVKCEGVARIRYQILQKNINLITPLPINRERKISTRTIVRV